MKMKLLRQLQSAERVPWSVIIIILWSLLLFSELLVATSSSLLRRRDLSLSSSLFSPSNSIRNISICRVSVVDVEDDDDQLVCDIVTDKIVSDYFLRIAYIPKKVIEANNLLLANHTWYIEYTVDQIERNVRQQQQQRQQEAHLGNLYFIDTKDVITVPQSEVAQIMDYTNTNNNHRRRALVEKQKQQRKLKTLGQTTLVVVLVGHVQTTHWDILKHIYGETESLSSQMAGCSHDQMRIVPHPDFPILRVNIDEVEISQYTFLELYQASVRSIREQMNLTWREPLPLVSDYYLFVVPDSIHRLPHEVGWAALNGYYFGVMESWLDSVQTVVHEMGHNFGNAHAFENNIEYADTTTVMGFSQRGISKLCFNGQNIWHMEWFMDRRLEISSLHPIKTIQLAFYGDYDKTTSDQPVILKIMDNIYLTYNRKKGINGDTLEYGDRLLIVREEVGELYKYSNLLKALSCPEDNKDADVRNQVFSLDDLFIEVCSCSNSNEENYADFIEVAIGGNKDRHDHQSNSYKNTCR